MKSYRIRNESGAHETLHITAEADSGYYVRVDSDEGGPMQSYHDFLPFHLFDVLIKNGRLEDFDAVREAS